MNKVVVYPKDTEKWKQFTTKIRSRSLLMELLCIPKILKNESNSQRWWLWWWYKLGCCVSQRYWKMKAIHNLLGFNVLILFVVVYPKDTEKWKQFTTVNDDTAKVVMLLCIPKILKNESNSQQNKYSFTFRKRCCVSQRYWKMKAIHNTINALYCALYVVVYPKDTEKWKQFTTLK